VINYTEFNQSMCEEEPSFEIQVQTRGNLNLSGLIFGTGKRFFCFRMSVLSQGPLQLPSHWVLGLKWLGHEVVTSFIVVLRLRMSVTLRLLPVMASWHA